MKTCSCPNGERDEKALRDKASRKGGGGARAIGTTYTSKVYVPASATGGKKKKVKLSHWRG